MQRKTKKKKGHSLSPLAVGEETVLTELLQEAMNLPPERVIEKIPSPSLAKAFIERLPLDRRETVPLLLAFRSAFEDKEVRKAIKRVIFKLEQRGTSIPGVEPDRKGAPLSRPVEKGAPSVLLGAIDASGSRPVFVALPLAPSGFQVAIGVVSDELGMIHFHAGRYSKKRMRELESHLREEVGPAAMVEGTLSHAVTILEEAYRAGREEGGRNLSDYLSIRPILLEKASLFERPPIYDLLTQEESPSPAAPSQLEKLFSHDLLKGWLVDPPSIQPLLEEIQKVGESPIYLSEAQKLERIRNLEEKWIEENYPPPRREKMRRRLEEMAYIFFRRGEQDFARLAVQAARAMGEPSRLTAEGVLTFLLERSLRLYMGSDQETPPKTPSSPILMP